MKILSIHLTDLCNSRCIFCVVGVPEMDSDTIVPEKIRRTLIENAGKGYEAVNIHGGEATVYKGFIETLKLIKELGYPQVHLQTNGRKLKDISYVQKLRELNVVWFIVSMHGLTEETHEWLTRAKGGFREAIEGIKNVKRTGGLVRTNTVITKQNIAELPDMMDMLLDLGVDHINISNLHPVETAYLNFDSIATSVEEIKRWVPQAMKRALDRGAVVTLEGFPICTVPGYEGYHLGRRPGIISMEVRGFWISDYDRFMDEVHRVKGTVCQKCVFSESCGGVYREYIEKRGWSEFAPILYHPATV